MAYLILAHFPNLIPIGLKGETARQYVEAAHKVAIDKGETDSPEIVFPGLAALTDDEIGDGPGLVYMPPGFRSGTAIRTTTDEVKAIVDADWDEELTEGGDEVDPEEPPSKKE